MLKLIIRQANWGILGSVFAFAIGFFVKRFVFNEVGPDEWGKYATAHTFSVISDTLLSISIPYIILKFIPKLLIDSEESVLVEDLKKAIIDDNVSLAEEKDMEINDFLFELT